VAEEDVSCVFSDAFSPLIMPANGNNNIIVNPHTMVFMNFMGNLASLGDSQKVMIERRRRLFIHKYSCQEHLSNIYFHTSVSGYN